MNTLTNGLLVIAVCLLLMLFSVSIAGQSVDFSNEALAKEILLGKDWICFEADRYGAGNTTWKFEKVDGKKVVGTVHMGYCPTETGTFRGKLKKNKLKFNTNQPPPCANRSGVLEFVHQNE